MTSTLPVQPESTNSTETDDHAVEEHGDFRMFGLATFLVADAMTFAGFFAAYLTFKAVNPLPEGAIYELELPLPILNTVLLLVSSATFHKAGQAIRNSDHKRCRRWLLITASLGIAFLISQMVEYFTLPFGLTDNLYASTFFAATGFHGTPRHPRGRHDTDRVVASPRSRWTRHG